MTRIGPAEVVAAGARLVGCRVDRVERLAGSVGNEDFMLSTGAGDFVLKASAHQNLAVEAWACQRVAREGVLVPEVVGLETEPSTLPLPFLVMRRLPGAPVLASSPALLTAGEQLAVVHSLRLDGYGELAVDGPEGRGRSTVWTEFVGELTSGLPDLVAAGVLPEPLAAAASAALQQVAGDLGFRGPAALLHGDLKLAHLFATPGGRVGLIDWGDACAGDPRLDLGRMSMAPAPAFATFLTGYGTAPTPELTRALAGYRLVWNIDALTYEFRAQGDWFDSYRAGIRAAVAELAAQ